MTRIVHKPVEMFYTREQLKKILEKQDTDKDGKLSMKELKSAFQELQSRFPRFRAEVAMRKCDKNDDGYIEFGKELESVVSYAEECHYTVDIILVMLVMESGKELSLLIILKLAMGVKKDTQKEKDVKNFRWSQPMENLLLEILANEALQGNKPSNIFKPSLYRKVVEAINEKFWVDCSQKNVENRFRTVKGNWNTMTKVTELCQKSGFGWNNDLKMITCDRNVYDKAVAACPNHANFLNKKIEMYDELALVVGKDIATGSFSKGVTDIDGKGVNDVDRSASNTIDLDNDLEEVSLKKQADSSTQTRSHRKRSHASMLDDTIFKDLSS
uniref:EF-hand domain-containing protein n=1 Tax=Fagus sylvatica TaxID=28930 RepID=A0A2N9FNQ3_FAGSY